MIVLPSGSTPAQSAGFRRPDRTEGSPWPIVVLVVATALAVIAPFWLFGTSKGSDFEFHIPLWLDAAGQWRQGVWFPRWAEQAEYGFGQPTFIFYPPLSWLLGAAVTVVLPLNAAPAGYVFLVALLAGTSMFRLASRSLSRQQAALAAFLYAAGPYPLLLVYQHASFAEVLAGALFPLLLLYALQTVEGIRSVVPLAIVFASVWLSNLPGALIATYSLGLVLLLQSALRRSTAPLLYGGGAIALGLALASFYLLPAWYEQRWVQIGEVLAPGLEPETNFLFGWTYDPVVGWYPVLLSAIAAIEIMLTCVALVWLLKWRRVAAREVQWILLVLAAVSIILMFPISGVAWESLPKLRFVQFPTRWLTVLSASLVMLLSGIVEARRRRVWLVGAAALAFAAVSIAVTTAWHSHAATELQRNAERSQGYFGRPEYMPGQSKYEEIWQWVSTMPLAAAVNDLGEPENADVSHVYVELGRWTPEHKELVADARQPVTLGLRLLAYPAWQVDVNGQRVQPIPEESTGRMLVPIPAGHNEITVHFVRTPDRAIGAGLSLLALLIVCCLLWWGHGKPSAAPGVQARTRKVVRSLEPLL